MYVRQNSLHDSPVCGVLLSNQE